MRIPSGKTDQSIYFVAVSSTDFTVRKTGATGFTVYRSRNGGTATVYTTPTITELSAANMPGVYCLLIDEDTTIASGSDSEEYAVHITATGMAPVTRSIELYRRDTTSGRTLDVSTGGEAGLDWANIGSPTTTVDLSGTTIKITQKVDVDTIKTNPVANGGTVTFPTNATLASTTNITAGTITSVTGAVGSVTGNVGGNVSGSVGSVTGAVGSVTGNVGGNVTGSVASVTGSVGSVTGNVGGNVTGSVGSVASGGITAASFAVGAINAAAVATNAIDADAIAADAVTELQTGLSTLTAADIRSAIGLTSANLDTQLDALPTANENADALLDRSDGIETSRTPRQSLRVMLAALAGKASGLATTTATYRDTNDSKNRIVASVDADGNRSAVTLDTS